MKARTLRGPTTIAGEDHLGELVLLPVRAQPADASDIHRLGAGVVRACRRRLGDDEERFGLRIRNRLGYGWFSAKAVEAWESGRCSPTLNVVLAMLELADVTLEEVLEEVGASPN